MRLHYTLSPNTEIIPFNHLQNLIGRFHRWMGENELHDKISLYSMSWLQGGEIKDKGFDFANGAKWFISFWDESVGKQLIKSALKDPDVCFGMKVTDIKIQDDPNFSTRERFLAASPIFIRKYDENKKAIHLTVKDDEADFYLTQALHKKLKISNMNLDVQVCFDKSYLKPKTKLVTINGIDNRANFCPILIKGDPEAVKFAWNVGVGHSTGCGFGALC